MMETYCIFGHSVQSLVDVSTSISRFIVESFVAAIAALFQCLILNRGHHPIRYVHVNIKIVLNQRRLNMITCNHVELEIFVYSDCYLQTIRIHM